jgi:hypothetical protein
VARVKARGFLQIVPERRADGVARELRIMRVTKRSPLDPLPGAIIVKVCIDVPDELANVQTVEVAAKAGMLTLVLEAEPE